MVRSTAIVVIVPPTTSHHAGDSNPEKITEGLAISNTAANRKNKSVVIDWLKNPNAQAKIVNATRTPPRTNSGEASKSRGESQRNRGTAAVSAMCTLGLGAREGTQFS
jgi:hypothetical protein